MKKKTKTKKRKPKKYHFKCYRVVFDDNLKFMTLGLPPSCELAIALLDAANAAVEGLGHDDQCSTRIRTCLILNEKTGKVLATSWIHHDNV